MEDTCKESLVNTNKKTILSFFSISEKQEESSNSFIDETKFEKQLISDDSSKNKFLKFTDFPKNIYVNDNNKSLPKLSIIKKRSSKSFNQAMKDKENNKDNKDNKKKKHKKSFQKENNNKIRNKYKRISLQNKHNFNILRPIKSNELLDKRKNLSSKNPPLSPQIKNKISLKGKQNINLLPLNNPLNNNINNNINRIYNLFNTNPITSRMILRNKSFNISSSETINQFYNNKKPKTNIILSNKKLKINDGYERLQINLFEKLKKSPMFEKSEKIIYKGKIIFGFLGFSSLMSILFQIFDVILYNKNSYEYLKNINMINNIEIDLNNISDYLQKRTISREENSMRIFNILFSLFSLFLILYLHNNKNKYIKQTNKNNKNFYIYYNSKYLENNKKKRYKHKIDDHHVSIIPNNDEMIPKKKLPISEIIKTVLSLLINLVICPPKINKIFIIKRKETTHILSLSSIILIFTFFKIIIIYRSLIQLTPFNNLIYKTICKSKMVEMDFLFITRYFLNRFPMTFILINLIIIGLIFCILILCIEYFSFDNQKGFQINKNDKKLKNFSHALNLYLFYILKNIYDKNKPSTVLGLFLMIILGSFALIIVSYLIYYMKELIEFKPEEQKAYAKLIKILNPINKEHKAANLVKVFFLMKKLSKDFKNTENEYTNKKLNKNQQFQIKIQRRPNLFYFGREDSDIYNNFTMINEINQNNERNNFVNYLCEKFILKIKLMSECKNLKNNLLIARNFSHSFTDLLKTLGQKMNENLYQLNSKLQKMIKIENKYKDFLKLQRMSLKKIKKILEYQDFSLNYLINKHNNENYENFLRKKRRIRKAGTLTGSLIYSNKQLFRKKNKNNNNNFDSIKSIQKISINRVKSSFLGSGTIGKIINSKKNNKNQYNKINNDKSINKNNIKKSKSFDNCKFININNIKKLYIFGFTNINKIIIRKNTYK